MLLYNQTKNRLTWDTNGREFVWEPFGGLDLPDELVAHVKAQRVPVGEEPARPLAKAEPVAAAAPTEQSAPERPSGKGKKSEGSKPSAQG